MNRNWKRAGWLVGVLLTVCVWAAGAADESAKQDGEGKPGEDSGKKVVAVVDGIQIREADLKMTIQEMRRQFGEKTVAADSAEVVRRKAFEQFLAVALLYQDGQTLDLKDVDQQVENMWSSAEKQAGGKEKFVEQLAKDGLTAEQARDNIKKNIYVRAVISQKVTPTIKVDEEELKSDYQAHQEQYRHGEMVGARHILIKVAPKAGEEEKKKAREKIEEIRKELLAGKDFQETAKEKSDCPSKTRGGDLGFFGKGRMVPEFEKVAFELKENEISPVVETQFGFHLIQVYGRKPAGVAPFDEVRKQIEAKLKGQKFNQAVNQYVGKLREKAKIEYLDPSLKMETK